MPLGDIAAGILEVVGRFIAEIFMQIVFELLIKGPGYLILRYVLLKNDDDIDPDGVLVIFIGITFWAVLGFGAYSCYGYISIE